MIKYGTGKLLFGIVVIPKTSLLLLIDLEVSSKDTSYVREPIYILKDQLIEERIGWADTVNDQKKDQGRIIYM